LSRPLTRGPSSRSLTAVAHSYTGNAKSVSRDFAIAWDEEEWRDVQVGLLKFDFWMIRPRSVGSPKTVPNAHCRENKTANASSREVKFMAVPNTVAEKGLDLETGVSRAKLTAIEVAKLLKAHLTTVYKMTKHGELPGFKIASDWRFDPAQIEGWIRSRMQGRGG
jgi:excisionase family DNA binding protein